jgi:hypothetical protein
VGRSHRDVPAGNNRVCDGYLAVAPELCRILGDEASGFVARAYGWLLQADNHVIKYASTDCPYYRRGPVTGE